METDVKYRIVKSGKSYAIQKKYKFYPHGFYSLKEGGSCKVYAGIFHREVINKDSGIYFSPKETRWKFLEPQGTWEPEDEDIKYVGLQKLLMFDCRYTRIYKTKKAAQDVLKQHLWETMVEPIDSQENWKQVNKD